MVKKIKKIEAWLKPIKNSRVSVKRRSNVFWSGPSPSTKKNMSWHQAKTKYPKLNPYSDADRDGVKNFMDCKPFDRKRQGIYHLPMTKKGYYREFRKKISPIVIRHKRGNYIETIDRTGVTSYNRIGEEKMAQLNASYPNEEPLTVADQIRIEEGSSRGVLAKGRTPGKIIFKQRGYQKRSEYDYRPEEKVRQLAVVDTNTGDIETFQESNKWTKAQLDKERAEEIASNEHAAYHPISELGRIQETSEEGDIEILNPSPIDIIKEKREALRNAAFKDKIIYEHEFRGKKSIHPNEETAEAFKEVTEEPATEAEESQ